MAIELEIGSVQPVDFDVGDADSLVWDMDEYIRMVTESLPEYEGPYEATPSEETQTFDVGDHVMRGAFVVNPIPSNWGRITWDGSVLTVS